MRSESLCAPYARTVEFAHPRKSERTHRSASSLTHLLDGCGPVALEKDVHKSCYKKHKVTVLSRCIMCLLKSLLNFCSDYVVASDSLLLSADWHFEIISSQDTPLIMEVGVSSGSAIIMSSSI